VTERNQAYSFLREMFTEDLTPAPDASTTGADSAFPAHVMKTGVLSQSGSTWEGPALTAPGGRSAEVIMPWSVVTERTNADPGSSGTTSQTYQDLNLITPTSSYSTLETVSMTARERAAQKKAKDEENAALKGVCTHPTRTNNVPDGASNSSRTSKNPDGASLKLSL